MALKTRIAASASLRGTLAKTSTRNAISDVVDLIEHLLAALGEVDGVGAAVGRILLAGDETRALELIEQADQRGALDANGIGKRRLADILAQPADPDQRGRGGLGDAMLGRGVARHLPP